MALSAGSAMYASDLWNASTQMLLSNHGVESGANSAFTSTSGNVIL